MKSNLTEKLLSICGDVVDELLVDNPKMIK
jgi:hypothetical protein